MFRRKIVGSAIGFVGKSCVVLGGLGAVGATMCVSRVPSGHIGIRDTFGQISDRYNQPGLVFKAPWTMIHKLSVQTQMEHIAATCPSREGLNVELEGSVFYKVNPDKAVELYKTVGKQYRKVILQPTARALVRKLTAAHEVKDLYSDSRADLEDSLKTSLKTELEPRGIEIEATPFQKIVLPEKLTQSIEQKLQMEQDNMRMDFVLAKEQKEAERKKVEAQGIADFQKIVSKGIDSNLLKWKGIEATEHLANSPNAKVVVVGGADGLPLILNGK
eukprot:TRINITY_DN84493_c0_g1_i1.p1 TRINITY_DN84493_c0_g1~~TRINITY_DN84493_c0_g1_i1.p1  ORF type:complete len:302 (+),score=21.09 TRINITY_DN84493_c0_g1_i1:85-906(+)